MHICSSRSCCVVYGHICEYPLPPFALVFLAQQLLSLGEKPGVIGDYVPTTQLKKLQDCRTEIAPPSYNLVKTLVQCGHIQPPLEGPTKDLWTAQAWAHIHRAPKAEKWSDLLSSFDPVEDSSRTVIDIVIEAAEHGLDLDYVVVKCIHSLPKGIVGFGQSAEARAYLFSSINNAYDYGSDVLAYETSQRANDLLVNLKSETFTMQRVFIQQMRPILESFISSVTNKDLRALPKSAGGCAGAFGTGSLPPFWLYLLGLSALNLHWSQLESVFLSAWRSYEHLTVPTSPPAVAQAVPGPLPLMTIIGWLMISSFWSTESTKPTRGITLGPEQLSWILSVPISDVDGLLRVYPRSFINNVWFKARSALIGILGHSLCRAKPTVYQNRVHAVACMMVDLHKYVFFLPLVVCMYEVLPTGVVSPRILTGSFGCDCSHFVGNIWKLSSVLC